ncbi:MAG: PA14 domain-containing protein, partial [Candidatus Hydrogenedens sp.]
MKRFYPFILVIVLFSFLSEYANAYVLGEYYTGTDINISNYRAKRLDANINFDWGEGGPGIGGLGADSFSIGWRGWIYIPNSGSWTFYTITDDGVRLYVNDQLIIDHWSNQGAIEWAGSINLNPGWNKFALNYFENTGNAVARFLYEGPGVSKQVIPASAFDINRGVTQFQGIHARYYRWSGGSPPNPFTFANWSMNRYDPNVNFDWGTGDPDIDNHVGADTFAVIWHGNVYIPTAGNWTFYTITDDGARLWVDGTQRINQWQDQGVTEASSGVIYLDAGWHNIEMQYYENGGGAVARLSWEGPGVTKQIIPQLNIAVIKGVVIAQYFNTNWPPGGTSLPSNFASERLEYSIWNDWGTGSPEFGVTADNFAGRWIGKIEIPTTGNYTFYVYSDDGADLYVNGTRIINRLGQPQPPTEYSGTINLIGGRKYYFELKYDEFTGGAVCQVSWSGPGISKQMIPESVFYPILNEAPSDISISNSTIGSNLPAGYAVGTLSTTDIDNLTGASPAQTHTYTLVSGTGFYIDGNILRTVNANMIPGSYPVRILTTDNGQRPDNLSYAKDITITVVDTTPPTVSSVQVVAARWVQVTFSEAMGSGVTTTTNYSISGTGKGTLSTNPNSVQYVSGNTYRLIWTSGEMKQGGDVTITVSGVRDVAGNLIGTPNNGTHTGGGMYIEAPSVTTVTAPSAVNTLPITINYSGASDTSSGINTVELWYKKGSSGTWTDSSLRSSSSPNGSFSFNGVSGEDTYYFDVVVIDGAGNRSDTPTGNGKTSTKYDITNPVLGVVSVSAYTNAVPVPISYSSATDNLSGVATYRMYYKQGAGGSWTDMGMNLDPSGGVANFTVPGNQEGTYYLA